MFVLILALLCAASLAAPSDSSCTPPCCDNLEPEDGSFNWWAPVLKIVGVGAAVGGELFATETLGASDVVGSLVDGLISEFWPEVDGKEDPKLQLNNVVACVSRRLFELETSIVDTEFNVLLGRIHSSWDEYHDVDNRTTSSYDALERCVHLAQDAVGVVATEMENGVKFYEDMLPQYSILTYLHMALYTEMITNGMEVYRQDHSEEQTCSLREEWMRKAQCAYGTYKDNIAQYFDAWVSYRQDNIATEFEGGTGICLTPCSKHSTHCDCEGYWFKTRDSVASIDYGETIQDGSGWAPSNPYEPFPGVTKAAEQRLLNDVVSIMLPSLVPSFYMHNFLPWMATEGGRPIVPDFAAKTFHLGPFCPATSFYDCKPGDHTHLQGCTDRGASLDSSLWKWDDYGRVDSISGRIGSGEHVHSLQFSYDDPTSSGGVRDGTSYEWRTGGDSFSLKVPAGALLSGWNFTLNDNNNENQAMDNFIAYYSSNDKCNNSVSCGSDSPYASPTFKHVGKLTTSAGNAFPIVSIGYYDGCFAFRFMFEDYLERQVNSTYNMLQENSPTNCRIGNNTCYNPQGMDGFVCPIDGSTPAYNDADICTTCPTQCDASLPPVTLNQTFPDDMFVFLSGRATFMRCVPSSSQSETCARGDQFCKRHSSGCGAEAQREDFYCI